MMTEEGQAFPIPSPENPLRSPNYIAEAMDVRPYTVREWLRTGKLKGYQDKDNGWKVLHSDFIAFLQERYGSAPSRD